MLAFVSFLFFVSLIGFFIFAIKALIDRLRGNESKTSKRLTFIFLGLTVGFFSVTGLVTEEPEELKALKAETDKMLEEMKNSPVAEFDERALTSDLLKVIENSQGSITDIRPALDDWEAVQVIVANEMRLFNEDQRDYFVSEVGPIVKSIIMNHGASENPLIVFRYHDGDKMGEYF